MVEVQTLCREALVVNGEQWGLRALKTRNRGVLAEALLLIHMHSYPHGKHAYQKTGAEYKHGPEALCTAKKLYNNQDERPYYNDRNDISAQHGMGVYFIKVRLLC